MNHVVTAMSVEDYMTQQLRVDAEAQQRKILRLTIKA